VPARRSQQPGQLVGTFTVIQVLLTAKADPQWAQPADLQSADDLGSATSLTWARITRPVVLRQGHSAHIPR
jgi:hypothetical protein